MTILTLENLVSYVSEYSPKPSFTTVSLRAALVKQASSVSLFLLLLSRDGNAPNSRCDLKARGLNRYLCTGKPAEVTPILQPNLTTTRVRPQDYCLRITASGLLPRDREPRYRQPRYRVIQRGYAPAMYCLPVMIFCLWEHTMVWSSAHTSSILAAILGISFARRLCAVIAVGILIENRVRRAVYQ
jgi:hypothetical protein